MYYLSYIIIVDHLDDCNLPPTTLTHAPFSLFCPPQVLAAQDSYPKQICQFDEPSLSIPFVPLAGEYAQFVGRTADGLMALSNYRVFLQQRDATYHIPLGVIETIECREIFFLFLLCKDTKSYK